MKKLLLTLAVSCFAAAGLRADLIWYEGFNYADGATTNVSAGTWLIHSTGGSVGTPAGNDSFVKNQRLEISGNSSTNAPRQADIHRNFCTSACTYTNGAQIVYASFTINCTNLPTAAASNYIAHFYVNGSTFQGRVFSLIGSMPGTWRLGISATNNGVNKTFPADLAPNTDYQVVLKWNPTTDNSANDSFAATLWVNPLSSGDVGVISSDPVTAASASTAFAFRQAAGATSFFADVTNLAVSTTFDEAATNVWNTNAVAPIVAIQPRSRTNFVSDAVNLFAVIAGQGQRDIAYQWMKDGVNISNPNGNSNVLAIVSAAVSDSGNYALVGTTPYGLSVTTAVASLWVTNPPVPPTIVQQPGNTNVFTHQNVSLKVVANGPPPLSYQWFLNNTALVDSPNFQGSGTDTLIVSDVTAANGTTGTYRVEVSNGFGTTPSTNFVLSVTNPPAVSIAYLRTLVDNNFIATNTSQLWQVTGTVTTFTNLTTGNTSSYYVQDATAGINMFVTLGQTFRPQQGDVVNLVGFLQSFQGNLELEADTTGNPATSYTVLSNNLALLPAPIVLPYNDITNDVKLAETLEGSVVMLTNVFFTNSAIVIATNANTTTMVTNASGQNFSLLFSSQDQDTANQTLPSFAYTVRGILTQNTNSPNGNLNRGYQLTVTKFSDIVTDPPPAVTLSNSHAGNITALSWDATPYAYSYSVLTSPNLLGPYLPTAGYQAKMLGANENPGNGSSAMGFGTVELSPDQTKITVNLTFSGLSATASAAHIHGPAGAGTNASVLFPFTGVPSATSGSIPLQTFAITPTQLGYLQNGLLYMNVHNSIFPGGEIRAQILPVPSTGLTFTNAMGFYTDRNATNSATFYRIVSP